MGAVTKWRSLDYLNDPSHAARGADVAAELFSAIQACELDEKLRIYMPILVTPHAVGLDLPNETATFLCEVYATDAFRSTCENQFSRYPRFQLVEKTMDEQPAIILRFKCHKINFEVIGKPQPLDDQTLFQLTVMQSRLLQLSTDTAATKRQLFERRQQQEASLAQHFCDFLQLKVEPGSSAEQTLLTFAELDDPVLQSKIGAATTATAQPSA